MRRQVIHAQRQKTTAHSHRPESPQRTRSPISPLAMRTPLVQPKLTVNPAGDRYEQEADEMANRVMRMPAPAPQLPENEDRVIQRQPLMSQITPVVQRQKEPEEETAQTLQRKEGAEEKTAQTLQRQDEEPKTAQTLQRQNEETQETSQNLQRNEEEPETVQTLQRKEESEEETAQAKAVPGQTPKISPNVESRIQSQRGSGQPLPDSTRAFFEPRFGADFSRVRVHTNAEANSLSSEINARAFTVGKDIFVGSGQYNPDSSDGRQLLAHELTHTVQQRASLQRKPNISSISTHTVQRGVWSWVEEKAVRKFKQGLNWLAERTIPGYTLLNVFLGKNLITEDAVARSGVNLIKGYMRLEPVIGSILLSELEETKSLPEAGKWVEDKVAKIGIDFNDLARRLKLIWDEMSIDKKVEGNIQLIVKHLGPVLGKLLDLSSVVMEKVKELRFEAALRLVGATELLEALKQDPKAFKKAVDDPKAVLKQFMVGALKQGFTRFKDNFIGHFKNALLGWLFGKAAEMGVEMPKKFDVVGLFSLVAQLVGATYQKIRARVVKRLGAKGEMIVSKLEQTVAFVKDLVTKGPIALWELVETSLSNFKEMIVSQIASLVSMEIIKTAVIKLLSMLNPVGALVQLALTLYRVIKFFIDQWETIKSVATGILNAIGMVALNKIDSAAKSVESVLATGIKLIISFLARIFNLGGIVDKVKTLIKNISDWIQKPIDKVIDLIVVKGKILFSTGKAATEKLKEKLSEWWKVSKKFKTKTGQLHTLSFKGKEKNAQLIIASSPKKIEDYIYHLLQNPTKNSPNQGLLTTAQKLVMEIKLLTKRNVNKGEEEKIIKALTELTFILAKVGGLSVKMPTLEDTDYDYDNGPKTVLVKKLWEQTQASGEAKTFENLKGWDYIKAHKLSSSEFTKDIWVRQHLVSAKIGGNGQNPKNLIWSTNSINTGSKVLYGFEMRTKQLLSSKPSNVTHNVIWVNTQVNSWHPAKDPKSSTAPGSGYDGETFAKQVTLTSGLYIPKGNEWERDKTPRIKEVVSIPQPSSAKIANLSFPSKSELIELDSRLKKSMTGQIKDEAQEFGEFTSIEQFQKRMIKRLTVAKAKQVNASKHIANKQEAIDYASRKIAEKWTEITAIIRGLVSSGKLTLS